MLPTCLAKDFVTREVVSISFHPSQPWLAIASGKELYLWHYGRERLLSPWVLMHREQHFRGAEFTLDGKYLITAQADDSTAAHYINGRKEMTVHVQLWKLNIEALCEWFRSSENEAISAEEAFEGPPQTIIRNAALYNDGGFDISQRGDSVCAVRFIPEERAEPKLSKLPRSSVGRGRARARHRAIARSVFDKEEDAPNGGRFELVSASIMPGSVGNLLQRIELSTVEATGITSVKFSPTGDYIMLGRGRRPCAEGSDGLQPSGCRERSPVVSIYQTFGNAGEMRLFAEILSPEDAANIAVFHPLPGNGLAYGTQQGLVKAFKRSPMSLS